MIVVFGMAHSGTTILTHVLRQAPRVHLHTSGPQAPLLECHEVACHIPVNKWQPKTLKGVEARLPKNHQMLIKRPWTERYVDFWKEHFPEASYICLLRPFVEIYDSWTGPRSLCPDLKKRTQSELWRVYRKHLDIAMEFPNKLPACKFLLVDHPRLKRWPSAVFEEIGDFLGLSYSFDTSSVGNENIKAKLRQQPKRQVPKRKRSCCKQ